MVYSLCARFVMSVADVLTRKHLSPPCVSVLLKRDKICCHLVSRAAAVLLLFSLLYCAAVVLLCVRVRGEFVEVVGKRTAANALA